MRLSNRIKGEFLIMLGNGRSGYVAARLLGREYDDFVLEREYDEEFAEHWDRIVPLEMGGVCVARLTPMSLRRLLRSQASDEEVAAYYMMSVEELMELIEGDEELLRVYRYARKGALAEFKMLQYQAALDGDVGMQKWLGTAYLGQGDKLVVGTEGEVIEDDGLAARKLLLMLRRGDVDVAEVIDDIVDPVERGSFVDPDSDAVDPVDPVDADIIDEDGDGDGDV